ncbi:MAG: hypothetical protein JWQ19_924 [Subtercola sp.]|nr:hypothetical protein [Subtercola sp.]
MGKREHKRRPIAAVLVALVALALVVFVGGDFATRAFVEARIRTAVVAQLPEGMAGDVNVNLGGAPMLVQFASGSFAQVTVVSKGMLDRGVPFQSTVVVSNLPFDPAKPISRITATVSLSDEAATSLSALPGAVTVAFGDGTIVYRMPGQTATAVAATAGLTAAVSADGTSIVLAVGDSPTASVAGSPDASAAGAIAAGAAAPVSAPGAATGAAAAVAGARSPDADQAASVSVCVAKFLPAGVHVTSITPTVGSISMTVEGTNVLFSRDALAVAGTCP